jgi:hypothetical protein
MGVCISSVIGTGGNAELQCGGERGCKVGVLAEQSEFLLRREQPQTQCRLEQTRGHLSLADEVSHRVTDLVVAHHTATPIHQRTHLAIGEGFATGHRERLVGDCTRSGSIGSIGDRIRGQARTVRCGVCIGKVGEHLRWEGASVEGDDPWWEIGQQCESRRTVVQ